MMTQMLPASVEELNMLQQKSRSSASTVNVNILLKKTGFEDIPTAKNLKREVSFPTGVENWNISNFDSYLNFDEMIGNDFVACGSPGDHRVPEGDIRGRCASISSVSSYCDEKPPVFHNFGTVKTISTVHMDSGSTCISSDHSYFNSNFQTLDPEETYQNLDLFLQEVPEMKDTLPPPFSPLPSTSNDDIFELTVLDSAKSFTSDDSLCSISSASKRSSEIFEDDVFTTKHTKLDLTQTFEPPSRYHTSRRKNNIASKNCRKTRKEKQKDMEVKVTELEEEIEHRRAQVQILEQLIQAHKQCLLNAIAQRQ